MPGPSHYEVAESTTPTPSTSRHRKVHSLTTNASGIAYSTISDGTIDALHSQLGHFPPPPSEMPTPTTPRFQTFLVPVPAVHIAPLNLPQRNPHPDVPSETSQRPPLEHRPPIHYPSEEPIPLNGPLRPLRRQPSFKTYATNGTVGSLSPFDWHEGSSSIDVDPHDDRMLPTSFITSLISSSEHGSPRSNSATMSPLQNPAQLFSGGNNQDSMSLISDATYPPPHNYPPYSPPNRAIPPGAAYLESSGRSSKASSVGVTTLDTEHDKPSVFSHTPFVDAPQRYEPIEEDTMGELQARGETPKHSSAGNPSRGSLQGRRQSFISTRTTKSYISSLISKLSRATSRKRPPKPLPPLPAFPGELRNSDYQKFEDSMPLPQLANRAEVLSKMLASGVSPHDTDHSPSNLCLSMPSTGAEAPWNGVTQAQDASRSNWGTTHEVSFYQHHQGEEKVETPERMVGFWNRITTRFGKKRVVAMLIVMATLVILLAVLLGVLLRKKATPVLPKCPSGRTGTDCDIGEFILPSFFSNPGAIFLASW